MTDAGNHLKTKATKVIEYITKHCCSHLTGSGATRSNYHLLIMMRFALVLLGYLALAASASDINEGIRAPDNDREETLEKIKRQEKRNRKKLGRIAARFRNRKKKTPTKTTAVKTARADTKDLEPATTNGLEPPADGDLFNFSVSLSTRAKKCDNSRDLIALSDLITAAMRIGFLDQDAGFYNVKEERVLALAPLPTDTPSTSPSITPSLKPSGTPSREPSEEPSLSPTDIPSSEPSSMPSSEPSSLPSLSPTSVPSLKPSSAPSDAPSSDPSSSPSSEPSSSPSSEPSLVPSSFPSSAPSTFPIASPTKKPKSGSSRRRNRLLEYGRESRGSTSDVFRREMVSDSVDGNNYDSTQRELAERYIYSGTACRRCKGAYWERRRRRSGGRKLQDCARAQEPLPGDALSDANFAARMTTALRIMIVDTFGSDPESCFFNVVDSDSQVKLTRVQVLVKSSSSASDDEESEE